MCYSSLHVVLTYRAPNKICPLARLPACLDGLICPVFETGESTIPTAMPTSAGQGCDSWRVWRFWLMRCIRMCIRFLRAAMSPKLGGHLAKHLINNRFFREISQAVPVQESGYNGARLQLNNSWSSLYVKNNSKFYRRRHAGNSNSLRCWQFQSFRW